MPTTYGRCRHRTVARRWPGPSAPAGAAHGPRSARSAAQQRDEHRVGAVAVGPELEGAGQRAGGVGDAGAAGRRRPRATTSARPSAHRADHAGGLGDHRRAGGVERRRRRGGSRSRAAVSSARCSSTAVDEVLGTAAPARLRTAAQRAEAGAGGVDEHPVEARPARSGGPGAVGGDHAAGRRGAARGRAATRRGAVRLELERRSAGRRARAASAASSAALPPGPGAQVEPGAGVVGHRRRAARASATSCEPSSCTPARPSATAGTSAGLPPSSTTPYGESRRRRAGQLGHARTRPGRATRVTRGGSLSAASRASSSSAAPTAASARRSSSTIQRRVAVGDLGAAGRGRSRWRPAWRPSRRGRRPATLRSTALANPAAPWFDTCAHQVDGGADGGVGRHPHREQLVGAEPQRVEHLGVDPAQRPVDAGGEDGVVGAAPRAACRRPARWRTRRRARRARSARSPRAARGWRRRRRPGRPSTSHAARPARRGAASPAVSAARRAVPEVGRQPSRDCRPGVGGTSARLTTWHRARCRHSSRTPRAQSAAGIGCLPTAWTSPSRTAVVPVPTSTSCLATATSPAPASATVDRRRTGPSLSRSPSRVVQAPGAGRARADPAVDGDGGLGPVDPASSTVILGARLTPSAGCSRASRPPASIPSRVATSSPAPPSASRPSRSPAVSRRADRLGHHAERRAGVHRLARCGTWWRR